MPFSRRTSILLLCLLIAAAPRLCGQTLRYTLRPVADSVGMRLQIDVALKGDSTGITALTLPDVFGNQAGLSRCIRNLQCISGNGWIHRDPDSAIALLEHAPGAAITLRYEVAQDFSGAAPTLEQALRPVIQPDYFHALGVALFVFPRKWQEFDLWFEWRDFPADWTIHNSYGSGTLEQHVQCSGRKWLESVFTGGDFRVVTAEANGSKLQIALRGADWPFADAELLGALQVIVAQQQRYWESPPPPYFTVTLLPLADPGQGNDFYQYLGIGLQQSFAAFATPGGGLRLDHLQHLFRHEMQHEWLGNRIRCGKSPADMRNAWFSEGFAEYLAYRNILESGQLSPEAYLRVVNEQFVQALYRMPQGTADNQTLSERFFSDPAYRTLAYKRGFVLAFYLDNALRARNADAQTLRDWLLRLLRHYGAPGAGDLSSDPAFFRAQIDGAFEGIPADFYLEYVERGKRLPADAFILPPYLKKTATADGMPVFLLDKTKEGWEALLKN